MKDRNLLMDEETLFSQEEVFTPAYLPEDFLHRDSQLEEIKIALKPGLKGKKPFNLLLYGPPGTGKTTAIKFMFEKIKEIPSRLITLYINCEDFSTPYSILAKIYQKLFGYAPPSTGKPLEEVKESVFKKLDKGEKSLVVALDEMDRLFLEKNVDKILVDLLKAYSSYGYDRVGIIGIMIKEDFLAYLDEKARSIFNPSRVYFQSYEKKQIYDILSKRVEYGFYEGVVSDKVLREVVERTYQRKGDIRIGLDLLRKSGLIAEEEAAKKITLEHLNKAYRNLDDREKEEKEKTIEGDERKLLEVIRESQNCSSGHIYKIFREKSGTGIKKYNQMIASLERKNLIKTRYVKGKIGRSREIIPL